MSGPSGARSWRRRIIGMAVVALGAIAAACSGGGRSVEVVPPGLTPEPTATAVPALDLEPGWHALDAGPLAGRVGAVGVWTGDEVLVWGGSDGSGGAFRDGAAFDPRTGRWRALALAPLPARAWPVAVWTGTRMVVVGGVDGDGRELAGAIAYDPVEDSWQELDVAWGAVSPVADAVWTGERVVVVGATPPPTGDPLADMVSIDVEQGFLDVLATFGATDRRGLWAGWTGSTIVTATVADGHPVLVRVHDPTTGAVVGQPIDSGVPGLDVTPEQIGLVENRVVIPAGAVPGGSVEVDTGDVRTIPPRDVGSRWPAAVVDGQLSVGEAVLDSNAAVWVPAPVETAWARQAPVVVGAGDRIVVWGGDACGRDASCAALVPPEQTLVWLPPPP